ncbi:cardiomyopathy-associated protein 5-like [Oncorhynchus clarkii lewisi]|uniref:cardiomyopathy-associated protein 5-like n=1 Tax=Oncorhynchus clarkii lewisi TaxID=490388 RepID=UPI0039B95A13
MAHTFDPAYQGETYLNKSGVFEYAKDRQAREIMERLQDKDTVLDRPVTPESITSEEIQSFLNDWSTELRPNSPASVASLDEHRPLSPDSPIPQFIHQCCDNYVELPGDRSSSPQSVMSDVEYCALFLGELIPEHRPDSPDSFLADSEFRESIEQFFRIFRTLTPESVTSEGGYTFLELLFVESRPSSPESVTSVDEYRPLSPDSPVPQFLHQYCDYYGLFPADRSSSPESVTSEIEFSEFCLDESFAEDRADSPESFISEGEYEHVDETLTKSSLLPPEDEYAHSFVQYWLSELQLSSADPMISLDELDAAETSPSTEIEDSESHPIYEFSEGKTSTPEYRLVYKAVPSTLMAHTFDPAYQGDTYLSKTGVFEYAGDRKVRKALDRPHRSGEDLRPVSVEEPASPCQSATPAEEETVQEGSLLTVPHVTDQTVTETLHEPHLPISQPVETEIRTSSPVLAEREFTQSSSLPEYKTLSAESLGSDRDGVLLYLNHFFTDMRPSSPESVVSFDEYRPLSPDSPVPHFMPQCCHCYLAPTGDRSSSPQSETSDIEFSEVCLEELFTEDRADSPESYISEDGMRLVDESDKDMSQDRPMTPDSTSGESLSFVEDWFSELALKPSSPESVSSQEDLSPDSPVLQYGPGLSVVAVSTGEKCWTPESVISDWDEFGLEDLFCATRACSPDSICSNTDTVLTQGDGQRSPPTDQVSTEHEPEMRVERARLKQPPELIDAPFSLVFPVVCQTHRAVEAFFCRASSPDSHRAPVEDVDLDDVETHRPHQASSQSSHVPSDEHNLGSPVAAVRAEEAVHNRPQASRKSIQRKEHSNVPTLKGSEAQTKIDETSKHLKRKPMRKAEDRRVSAPSVSAGSSMENLSEPKHVLALDQPSTNRPISNKTLMSETQSVTPDLQIPNAFVFSPLSPEMTMPTEKMRVSPESPEKTLNLNKESSSSETSPVLPDLFSHNAKDSQGDEAQSSASNLEAPPESGAPTQLDQLLSEFEEIKRAFRPETLEPLDSPLSETSEGGLEDLQPYVELEELLPESDAYPTEGEEELSSPSPSSPIQITREPAEISVVASVPTDLSLSNETDPEVFGVTTDLIETFPEPSQVTADPVQLSHLEYVQTHRAEKSDLTGSIPLDSPTAATKSAGTPESPEPCHKVLERSSESIVPSQKFQPLEHEDAAVFTEPSTVEEHRISLPQQDQATVGEEYDNSKDTSSIQAAVKKAYIEQSKVLCESGVLITEPSQLVDETCMSTTPEVVSHLRDSTPPETLEYDEQSHHSLSDVTPQTPETVTVSRHFSFEELIPYQSPRYLNMLSEALKPNTSEQPSENRVTPVEEEFSPPVTPVEVKSHVSQPGPVDPMAEMVSAQPDPVEHRAEMVSAQPGPVEHRAEMVSAQHVPEVTASAHDEEFSMEFSLPPEYAEASSSIHKPNPPAYAEVIRGSTTMYLYEDSDPETYFDCKQGVSDFSEMEPDELKKRESSGVGQTQGQASHSGALGRKYQKPTAIPVCSAVRKHERGVLLSSGSEDYDDAPYDDIKEESEELAQSPGTHTDDWAFYQAPQELPPLRSADDDDSLDRQGEMTDIPPQTVTEEQYTDQHGHAVVRKWCEELK